MTCRILPYEIAGGPANMALDEALLEEVAGRGQTAYLRCYGWTIPTLSLGYFQRLAEIQSDPRWQAVPLVRRLTGGGAIWHHYEVTYALVVPAVHPQARPNTALYRAVHGAIANALVGLGLRADRRADAGPPDPAARKRPTLCFTDSNSEDIVSRGFKLVGSAQRRRRGAILQHGSVLLARSPHVPELHGVCDVADVPASPEYWSDRLSELIPAALGLYPEAVSVSDEVRARASELQRSIYHNPAWTRSR